MSDQIQLTSSQPSAASNPQATDVPAVTPAENSATVTTPGTTVAANTAGTASVPHQGCGNDGQGSTDRIGPAPVPSPNPTSDTSCASAAPTAVQPPTVEHPPREPDAAGNIEPPRAPPQTSQEATAPGESPGDHASADEPPRRGAKKTNHSQARRKRRKLHLPSKEEVLAVLPRLATGTALGTLSREDANSMRATLDTYLKHLGPSNKPDRASGIDLDRLRQAADRVPDVLGIVESLLSDDDVDEMLHDPVPNHHDQPGPGAEHRSEIPEEEGDYGVPGQSNRSSQ